MTVTRITADALFNQIPHGLIETNPVDRAESQERFGKLLDGDGTKTTDWKPVIMRSYAVQSECGLKTKKTFQSTPSLRWVTALLSPTLSD